MKETRCNSDRQENASGHPRHRWAGLVRNATTGFLIAGMVFAIRSASTVANEVGGTVESTRATLEKWVETRRIISREQRDWSEAKELLQERIDLVKREIESLRTRIAEAEGSVTEADTKRAELLEENEQLKGTSRQLSGSVAALESRTGQLIKRLPDPIRERVKPLSQRLPENALETKLSLAERYQNVAGILNEVNKFNREITLTSEVRALPTGTTAEVTAMYVGLGAGYYVSGNGAAAGVGTATEDGWIWTPANDAAPAIAAAIAILKNEQVATFVRLPNGVSETDEESK